ncbi:hypothetical protein FQR65_LT13058 [Abscondita terminalis]|nr:hypothetical protein FQR65_LT13058 [Abscondita terminalis]
MERLEHPQMAPTCPVKAQEAEKRESVVVRKKSRNEVSRRPTSTLGTQDLYKKRPGDCEKPVLQIPASAFRRGVQIQRQSLKYTPKRDAVGNQIHKVKSSHSAR